MNIKAIKKQLGMKVYLKSLVSQLKNFSLSLDKTSILIDKPWAMIDDEQEMQKLIFKKNKELILSKNGQVEIGKWDYFPEAKSLLIDRNYDKILCNEGFIDKGVMILKLDGTDNRFFVLANENMIPDLDADRYLKELRYQKLRITAVELVDGRILEIQNEYGTNPSIGQSVSIDSEPIEDGEYQLADKGKRYDIRKGKIFRILTETRYVNPADGKEIVILQKFHDFPSKGDSVFIYGMPAEDGIVDFTKSKRLIVKDGKVVKVEWKNWLLNWLL